MPSPPMVAPSSTNGDGSTPSDYHNAFEAKHELTTNHTSITSNGTGHQAQNVAESSLEPGSDKFKAVTSSSSISKEASDSSLKNGEHFNHTTLPSGPGNSSSQSRKRSRSGSRKPSTQFPQLQSSDHERKRQDAMLENFVQREQQHHAAKIDDGKFISEVLIDGYKSEIKALTSLKTVQFRSANPGSIFGMGWAGYGNDFQDPDRQHTRQSYMIIRERRNNFGSKRIPERVVWKISRKDQATQAEQLDELVPIRLDIEWDQYRLRDTFTWNIHDRITDIETFSRQLVRDIDTSPQLAEPLVKQVQASIIEQIQDYHPHVFTLDEPLDPHLPYFAWKNDEMRIVIKLNITIGIHTLADQFEWDINNHQNSPEEFAKRMTEDLSLNGEFTTAIAHSIREQCQLFTRSLYVVGHAFDGRPIEDHELQASFQASPVTSIFRPHHAAKEFTPYLYELNEQELEKTELSLSREERRQKRSVNRRGGPTLPDLKDRRRTTRTLLISSVLPGAVQSADDTRLIKKVTVSNRGKRGLARMDGIDDSEESESEESSIGSPAMPSHLLPGTARTRTMRGAGLAAQAATRSALGRSATPESSILHHHETRTSRRPVIRDDSSPEPQPSLIVKLRLSRQKFQQFLRAQRAKSKEALQTTPVRPSSRQSSAAPQSASGSMGPPTSTPRVQSQSLPTNGTPNGQSSGSSTILLGRVDATGPPGPDHPIPPPPAALMEALARLQETYPNDQFEAMMRYTAVSQETDQPFGLKSDAPPPPDTKYCYYPRIKCKDCPGKLYTPDNNLGINNFEVHLKNRHHRDRVAKRVGETSK